MSDDKKVELSNPGPTVPTQSVSVKSTRVEIVSGPLAEPSKEQLLKDQMGKALGDALNLLPPGGSVRKTVEAAHKAYLESK